jgi:uncharacterized protein (DUF2147 family)
MTRYLIISIVILFSTNVSAQKNIESSSANTQDVTGVWLTEKGAARINIYQTNEGLYEGKLVWSIDPSQKAKSRLGMVLLRKFKKIDEKTYKGYVYDPERQETYNTTITVKSKNELNLRAYIGISLFGRTEHWTRYSEPNK